MDAFQNECSEKFRNSHRKTPVLEGCFSVSIAKFLRIPFFKENL